MAKSFYTIIFTVTVVIAIIVLIFMAIAMFLGRETATWPPDVAECPDYWVVNPDGSCKVVPSVGNTGSAGCTTFDPAQVSTYADVLSNPSLNANSPRCKRKAWAQKCGVYWDGISDISPMYCVPPAGGGGNGGHRMSVKQRLLTRHYVAAHPAHVLNAKWDGRIHRKIDDVGCGYHRFYARQR